MSNVLRFNNVRKARDETNSSMRADIPDVELSSEIRGNLHHWVAELSKVIAHLEKVLEGLNAAIAILPYSQGKIDLQDLRAEIVLQIYSSRRYVADI